MFATLSYHHRCDCIIFVAKILKDHLVKWLYTKEQNTKETHTFLASTSATCVVKLSGLMNRGSKFNYKHTQYSKD